MHRLLWVAVYLLVSFGSAYGNVIRGSEEQSSALAMIDQLQEAVSDQDADEFKSDLNDIRQKILANQLDGSDFISLMQQMLNLQSFQDIIRSLNNQHLRCVATAVQNNAVTLDPVKAKQPYVIDAVPLEKSAMALKNKEDFTPNDFIQLLIMSQLCEGLPFREIREPRELGSRVKVHTSAFAALLQSASVSTDDMQLFSEFLAVRDSWTRTKQQINAISQSQRLDDFKFVLRTLKVTLPELSSQLIDEQSIEESMRLAELSLEAMAESDFEGANQLYEASIRRLFPLKVSNNKNTEELRLLAHIFNTQMQIRSRMTDDENVKTLDAKFAKLLQGSSIRSSDSMQKRAQDYQTTLQTIISNDPEFETGLDAIAVYASPDYSVKKLALFFDAADGALGELEKDFLKNMSFLQSFQKSYNQSVLGSMRALKGHFTTLRTYATKSTSLDAVQRLSEQQTYLKTLIGYYFEAVSRRNSSAIEYGKALQEIIEAVKADKLDDSYRQKHVSKLRRLMNEDTAENILWNAYLTRNNITVGALSVLVVVEGLTLQVQTIPMTLLAISAASKAVIVVSSSLNLLDRHHRDGWKGLLNLESAMDALTIMCLLPRGIPHGVTASTSVGRTLQNMNNSWALLSRSATHIAIYANLGLGGYQVAMAESIAERMKQQGIQITPAQVRQQGLKNLAFSLLFYTLNHAQNTAGQKKYGQSYQNEVDKLKFGNTTTGQAFKSMDPRLDGWVPRGFKNYTQAIRQSWDLGGVGGKMGAVWKAVAIPAYQYILANEAFFFSYTTPDFVFENHVKNQRPLPDLVGEETAVLFIGLDEMDILYAGSKSRDFLRDLSHKYGDRFFVYDFNSPHDFVGILKKHSEEHGPIKYLKVVTHGIPGLLATKESASSPILSDNDKFNHFGERGYISRDFLRNNSSWIKPQTESFMAPDAHIVLISCLVGGNYDDFEASYGPKHQGADDVGDQFLDEFSTTFLPHGGRVDASTRALIGINMVYSSLIFHASLGRQYEDLNRQNGILPLARYKLSDDGTYDRDTGYDDESKWTEPQLSVENFILPLPSQTAVSDENALLFSAKRFAKMIIHFPQVAYAYGVALEGTAWGERYAFRIVEPKR